MLFVRKGVPGLLRPVGGKWEPFKTTKDCHFTGLEVRDHSGGYLILTRGGWEFMVLSRHTGKEKKKPVKKWKFVFRKASKGRGASRRKNMRARRRH